MRAAAILTLFWLTALSAEVPPLCQTFLHHPSYSYSGIDPALAYHVHAGSGVREDRCEGVLTKPLSGSAGVQVLSFTGSAMVVPQGKGKSIPLAWRPTPDSVTVSVVSNQSDLSYRMDTLQPPSRTSYQWDNTIANSLSLSASQLFWLAWTDGKTKCGDKKILVPLSATPLAPERDHYSLILTPGISAHTVTPTLYSGEHVIPGNPAEFQGGVIEPDLLFEITLKRIIPPGQYQLHLSFKSKAGQEIAAECFEFLR